jgi:Zn-dependent protease
MAVAGIVVALMSESQSGVGGRVLIGLAYGALIWASIVVHYLGGAAAGGLLHAPMRQVIFTATMAYSSYDESQDYPSRVHVIRGLGEPAANLLLGAGMLGVYLAGARSHVVLYLAILNLIFFVTGMAPIPTMHGGIMLRHLKQWKPG